MKSIVLQWLTIAAVASAVIATPLRAQTRGTSNSFETIAAVLASPRCANCHISGNAPLQGEDGRSEEHTSELPVT